MSVGVNEKTSFWGGDYAGLSAQFGYQLTKRLEIGGGGSATFSIRDKELREEGNEDEVQMNNPEYGVTANAYTRYDLFSFLDILGGIESGYAETDLVHFGANTGLILGPEKTLTSLDLFKPYLGYMGAVSVPVKKGEPFTRETNYPLNDDQYPSTTYYHGAIGGLGVKLTDNSQLFADAKFGESIPTGQTAGDDVSAYDYKTKDFNIEAQAGLEFVF